MFQGLSLYLINVCGQRERGRQGGKGKIGRIGDSKRIDTHKILKKRKICRYLGQNADFVQARHYVPRGGWSNTYLNPL